MAIKNMKERIYSISDVFFQSEEVKKAMIDCFETGYRYDENNLVEEIKKAKCLPEGTPCLVRDNEGDNWMFRKANGEGRFYAKGVSPITYVYKYYVVLTQDLSLVEKS